MASAAEGLRAALAGVELRDAACPVICNVDARPVQRADEIRDALERQLLGAVRWEESMRLLLAAGVDGFVEAGTGKVLRGLLRTIERQAQSWNVEDPDSLRDALAALGVASATPERG
jgi:[acyl-carrier-protein] S-malonyltransferase